MKGIYCIRDIKASRYMNPFIELTDKEAIRCMQALERDSSTIVGKFPADFALYRIGMFDETTAEIILDDTKILLYECKGV